MKLAALLILAAIAAGCATKPTVWTRDGHTDAELQRETYRCEYEATVAVPANPRAGLVEAVDHRMRVIDMQRRCMRANGWTLENLPPVRAVAR